MDLYNRFLSWWAGPMVYRAWTFIPSETEKMLATVVFVDHRSEKHRWIVALAYPSRKENWNKNLMHIDIDGFVAVSDKEFGMTVYAPSDPDKEELFVERGFFPFASFVSETGLISVSKAHDLGPVNASDRSAFDMLSFLVPRTANKWFIENVFKWGTHLYDATYRTDGTFDGARLFKPALIHDGLTGRTWEGPSGEKTDQHAVIIREPGTNQEVLFVVSRDGKRFARNNVHPDRWVTTEPFWKQLVSGA